MKNFIKGDKIIWFIVILLWMISLIAVFSSGSFLARGGSSGIEKTNVLFEQLQSIAMGCAALLFCYFLNIGVYRKLAPIAFGISLLMLLMLFVPGLRAETNGAVRGLKIAGRTLQVFEFVKVGTVLFVAWVIERYSDNIYRFKDYFLKLLMWILLVCVLIVPNSFSSALLIAVVCFMIMFFMEIKGTHLLLTIGGAVVLVGLLFGLYHLSLGIFGEKANDVGVFNRLATVENRIKSFAGNESDSTLDLTKLTPAQLAKIDNENRQSENAKIAIAEGGIFGKGAGHSTQRFTLSMAFSDFIFSIIVEEYGLLGGILVIALYLVFLFRCISIARKCTAPFSQALVLGLAFLITTQAFLHILVNVRLIPITGHTLPLISHGGTAYLVLSGAVGMILSVSRTIDKQIEEQKRVELVEDDAEGTAGQSGNETETNKETQYNEQDNY
ncbi:MAG: FtsW/RodA/SpoVE family cell cycle protein [Bacteroidales bacterium]|nr:FtsW/RodA/SpoVE family cell cycle protein [Bacteroidales bacterium]